MFGLFPLLLVASILIIAKVMLDSRKNGKAPILTVEAKVVNKREEFLEGTYNVGTDTYSKPSTLYYAIFEVESGDRMEFRISYSDYNALAEGQFGRLTFQGRRLGSFKRI